MPRMDGTGPMGYGPFTGRGFGPCGRGMRRGFGRGFVWRQFSGTAYTAEPVTLAKEEQKKILEAELKEIEAEKKEIQNKLKELE